jgi:hypothetical protein
MSAIPWLEEMPVQPSLQDVGTININLLQSPAELRRNTTAGSREVGERPGAGSDQRSRDSGLTRSLSPLKAKKDTIQ